MNRELGISSQQFGLVAGIFFVGYVICQVPSNLLMHRIGARIWIARILVTWGVVAASTGFVHSVSQLCVARFLLGVAEAGFFPGIVLYLAYWFRQGEQALAIALFMTALPAALLFPKLFFPEFSRVAGVLAAIGRTGRTAAGDGHLHCVLFAPGEAIF